MLLPNGDWIVVRRHVRDTRSKGEIVRKGIKQSWAEHIVDCLKSSQEYNYWAMPLSIYKKPYSE